MDIARRVMQMATVKELQGEQDETDISDWLPMEVNKLIVKEVRDPDLLQHFLFQEAQGLRGSRVRAHHADKASAHGVASP